VDTHRGDSSIQFWDLAAVWRVLCWLFGMGCSCTHSFCNGTQVRNIHLFPSEPLLWSGTWSYDCCKITEDKKKWMFPMLKAMIIQWNFKSQTILKPLFWPKRREFVGPKFESHTSLYVIFCKNPGIRWSERFMVRSWMIRGSVFQLSL
jgi:hypothetical protein